MKVKQEVKAEKDLSPRRTYKDVCMNTFNNYDVNDRRTSVGIKNPGLLVKLRSVKTIICHLIVTDVYMYRIWIERFHIYYSFILT